MVSSVVPQLDTVGGGMHIVGLESVNTHKEKEKATSYFFKLNIMDGEVAVQEYVFKCKYQNDKLKFSGSSLRTCK